MFEYSVTRCGIIPAEKKAGVTFHSLRHTAASLMLQGGASVWDVAKILGHRDVRLTSERYGRTSAPNRRKKRSVGWKGFWTWAGGAKVKRCPCGLKNRHNAGAWS
jgi:integrase